MNYYMSRKSDLSYDDAITKAKEELQKEGFGILSEIDVKAKLKEKLDVDYPKYFILGTCFPPFAFKALQAENKIGVLLPCNVVVQEGKNGETEISVIDPMEAMQIVGNEEIAEIASEIKNKLFKIVEKI